MAALEEINRKVDELDKKFEAHRKHSNYDTATFKELISGEMGLMKSVQALESVVHNVEMQMVKMDTQLAMQIAKWGAIGGGFVGLVFGLLLYYLTKQK